MPIEELTAGLCPRCAGSGRDTTRVACWKCNGTGAIVLRHPTQTAADTPDEWDGICPTCDGLIGAHRQGCPEAVDDPAADTGLVERLNPLAMSALKNYQRQLDVDGCEVGVSRQALDELIAAYEAAEQREAAARERLDRTVADLEMEYGKTLAMMDAIVAKRDAKIARLTEEMEAGDDLLAAAREQIAALERLLTEAREWINDWADTAKEHDLIARIDAALTLARETQG